MDDGLALEVQCHAVDVRATAAVESLQLESAALQDECDALRRQLVEALSAVAGARQRQTQATEAAAIVQRRHKEARPTPAPHDSPAPCPKGHTPSVAELSELRQRHAALSESVGAGAADIAALRETTERLAVDVSERRDLALKLEAARGNRHITHAAETQQQVRALEQQAATQAEELRRKAAEHASLVAHLAAGLQERATALRAAADTAERRKTPMADPAALRRAAQLRCDAAEMGRGTMAEMTARDDLIAALRLRCAEAAARSGLETFRAEYTKAVRSAP